VQAGRSFTRTRPADVEQSVLLTESAVATYGLEGNPVGQTIKGPFGRNHFRVVGVVGNFHNRSLRQARRPVVLYLDPDATRTMLVRLAPGATQDGLDALRATWSTFLPDRPFTYSFLDQRIDAQYRAEQRLATLFGLFAGLAVLVAGLGLFGLATFTAQQRTKEIGIRKALGATVTNIVTLLSKEFVQLVGLAVLIGLLVAYVGLRRWLQGFAYRVDLGAEVFVLTGGVALVLAVAAVSYQALRTAQVDPAVILRDE
jgi:putative ABC transport system permease protein